MSGVVPKVRFGNFNDAWQSGLLGDYVTFSKGRGVSKADIVENGATPCIRYGELYTVYGSNIDEVKSFTNAPVDELSLSVGGEVVIPASGETAEDIATAAVIRREGVAIGGDLNILRSDIDGGFLASYLTGKKRREIARIAQGNSVVHVYSAQLATLHICVPSSAEQEKIATFLTAIDAKIDILRRKQAALVRFKAGLTQKLFSQELRFRREDGSEFPEWTPATLGELYDFLPTNSLARTDLTDEASEFRNVHYGDIHTKLPSLISGVDHVFPWVRVDKAAIAARQRPLRPGDVILADASEDLNDIGKAVEVVAVDERPIVAGLHTIHASPKVGRELAIGFASHLFRSANVRRRLEKEAHGTKVLGLSPARVAQVEVLLPCHDEQHAITGALSTTDAKIRATHAKIAHLETFKKGLLQQMFV